ncbi:hypothetical protein O181_025005 [Austropuccinia psidii MF-1]|uniref:Integrase catalytic domain-containing protein n=1 Tax=Austropuccinia psidii MF-1 TaxID=1389203 RepID=A0A9Q3H0P0_9BASI|nr:hypothetical protein [Austropuccinia psidii MF-1]
MWHLNVPCDYSALILLFSDIPPTGNHSSSDDEGYQTKIITLTRDNWVQWSCQLETFLAGKGHENLLSPPSKSDKISLKFKKRNGSALALLWTLNQDCEISGLVQTLYDIKPFELNSVLDRVAVEHCCQGPALDLSLAVDNKQKEPEQSKSSKQGGSQKKNRGVNRGRGKDRTNANPKRNEESLKRLDLLEKQFAKLKFNAKNSNVNVINEAHKETPEDFQHPDSDAYVTTDKVLTLGSGVPDQIYLDSGAGQSVVNNLTFLTNMSQVKKQVNTYADPPVLKGSDLLIKQDKKIMSVFHQLGNLFATKIQSQSVFSMGNVKDRKDWHAVLGHPSDKYIKKLFYNKKLSGSFISSNECQVCLHAKLNRLPHSWNLPTTYSPFIKIHIDTPEISPPSQQRNRYVLVIIDDYSRCNRIYLISEKGKAEGYISSYLNELKNKLNITPSYIHTDQGERGPPHSPQTNGVAEQFNQSLLTKIRCLLAQLNISISLWDEAAVHASMLLNHLPHKFLSMKSPNDLLVSRFFTIQPLCDLDQLLPFSIKLMVKNESLISKVHVVGKVMKALTYEPYSDGKIKITQDFSQLKSNTTIILRKDPSVLPAQVEPPQPCMVNLLQLRRSPSKKLSLNKDILGVQSLSDHKTVDHEPLSRKETSSKGAKSRYTYVPYYDTAPLDVSSGISTQNIIEGERHQRRPPDRFMLANVVTYKQAMSNRNKEEAWRSAMKLEYDSLMNHNTGELVLYPSNGANINCGMWRLTQKRNEFGHVYPNKAWSVVLGNRQEHLLPYFNTWTLVGRNETFKALLILVVNQGYIPYQFDIKTAFLHGEMDANVYVKQVKGFEVPGKEGWVWHLNKSLYGTKKAPRMWQAKLVSVSQELELTSTRADNSLYSNQDRTLFLHVHVNDGFLIGKNEKYLLIFLEKLSFKLSLKY